MSDQNDMDVDNGLDDFDDGNFEEFGKKGTLGDLWRNNPFVKIGIILAAFIFVVAGIILFGGKSDQAPASRVSGTADVNQAPGSDEISQAYRDAIEETNQAQTEQAMRDNSSALPIPTAPALGTVPQTLDPEEAEDPLDRWRRMQEERIAQQQLVAPEPAPVQNQSDTRTPAVNALAESMSKQMESVLSVQEIKGPLKKDITPMSYLEAMEAKRAQQAQIAAQNQAQSQLANAAEDIAEILVPAGTIEYAQLVTEANTDAPGPVMAQIQSGPLKGARVIGSFTDTEDYLTLNFNMVVVDGVNQSTSAVALDPATTLPGVVTDIDRRYWKRIILPAAASFVEGLADAVANSDKTTITIIGDSTSQTTSTGSRDRDQSVASGIEEAGSKIGDVLDQEAARTKPMLKVRAGTPLGILFLQPVLDKPLPSANPYGQPGFIGAQPYFTPSVNPYAPYNPYAPQTTTTTTTQPTAYNPYSGILPTNSNTNFFGNAGYFNNIGQTNNAGSGSK